MSGTIDEEFVYDVFISYHQKDIEWVAESVIKFLEDEGITVCWDSRDFEPGKTIIENKLYAICSSAVTVAILSPDYVKDENVWIEMNDHCGWDNDEIIKEFCLIPVVFKACQIPDIFQQLWKLDWTNLQTRKFFWRKLLQSIKKQRNGCFADASRTPPKKIAFAQKQEKHVSFALNHVIAKPQPQNSPNSTVKGTDSILSSKKEMKSIFHKNVKSERHLNSKVRSESSKTKSINGMTKPCRTDILIERDREENDSQAVSPSLLERIKDTECNVVECTQMQSVYNSRPLAKERVDTRDGHLIEKGDFKHEEETLNSSENDSRTAGEVGSGYGDFVDEDVYDDAAKNRNKIMESISPRILSFFVPEDDDLSRQDIEELTLKIEDVFAIEEAEVLHENTAECVPFDKVKGEPKKVTEKKKKSRNVGVFSSPQEQMCFLDSLQEREVKIKRKFENCCDWGRKRIYRRLLERFDKAIFSTVNGEKDDLLLAGLPISDFSQDENGGCCCPCCDRLFHSERALNIHVEQCVKQTWMGILRDDGTSLFKR